MASNRARNWNITINSEILPTPQEIEQKLLEIKAKNFAYITHNKDGAKRPHIHLVLEFENARDFNSLQKRFVKWHIEKSISLVASIQYLTHKNAPGKEQYTLDEITTNNTNWLTQNYELISDYINDEKQLIMEIATGQYNDFYDLILCGKYSMEWLNRRWQIINEMFKGVSLLQNKITKMKADKFLKDKI